MNLLKEGKINFIPLDFDEWNCPICGRKVQEEELAFYNERELEEYNTYGLCAACGRDVTKQLKEKNNG
jgi:hypothetical protein